MGALFGLLTRDLSSTEQILVIVKSELNRVRNFVFEVLSQPWVSQIYKTHNHELLMAFLLMIAFFELYTILTSLLLRKEERFEKRMPRAQFRKELKNLYIAEKRPTTRSQSRRRASFAT